LTDVELFIYLLAFGTVLDHADSLLAALGVSFGQWSTAFPADYVLADAFTFPDGHQTTPASWKKLIP
jgi:hypothetical protein